MMQSHLLRQKSFFPEVYETPDPTPSETKVLFPANISSSGDVDEKSVDRREAFQRFLGSSHTHNPHASAYLRTGDNKKTLEYSVHKGSRVRVPEAPLERYNRLRAEVDDFMRDLQLLQSEANIQSDSSIQAKEILKNMHVLQKDLDDSVKHLQGDATLGAFEKHNMTQASKSIKTTLENSGSSRMNPLEKGSATKVNVASSFSTIEERIAKLEDCIGTATLPEGVSNYHDLASGLHEKLTLIADPSRLDTLKQRLTPLIAQLETLAKTRAVSHKSPQDIDARVIQAFEILEAWEKYTDSLPILVQRLTTLQDIHSNAAKVVTQVAEMDRKHQQLHQLLQDNRAALSQLSVSFQENARLMQANSEILESRMEKVLVRLEKGASNQ